MYCLAYFDAIAYIGKQCYIRNSDALTECFEITFHFILIQEKTQI